MPLALRLLVIEAGIEPPKPDAPTVAPGDVERWRALLGGRAETSLP